METNRKIQLRRKNNRKREEYKKLWTNRLEKLLSTNDCYVRCIRNQTYRKWHCEFSDGSWNLTFFIYAMKIPVGTNIEYIESVSKAKIDLLQLTNASFYFVNCGYRINASTMYQVTFQNVVKGTHRILVKYSVSQITLKDIYFVFKPLNFSLNPSPLQKPSHISQN